MKPGTQVLRCKAQSTIKAIVATTVLLFSFPSWSFNSGSTGVDGPFNPTVNTELQIPPSGVFNFTSVNIPSTVTVTFRKNTTNSPVVILASGDVTIAGTINLSGKNAADVGSAGNGSLGDDGLPGEGGPGGFSGGSGGKASETGPGRVAGSGQGPGAGQAGGNYVLNGSNYAVGGGGAGFATAGTFSYQEGSQDTIPGQKGAAYGSTLLLPLIGGSGGGGGSGGNFFAGSGGGGGGGAILIASSGTVSITGSILANGGNSGSSTGTGNGASGGAGSGGAIRIVATTISGNGTISAQAGTRMTATGSSCGPIANPCVQWGGTASAGRVRLEAENFPRTAASNPAHTFGAPGSVFVTGSPTLRIASVAGVTAPAAPTGSADITLPASTPNPVTVNFETSGIPVGNNVKLIVTPTYGNPVTAVSNAITGTTASGTAATSVTLPTGPSTLAAQTTYTIVAALGDAMRFYAGGETVEKVAVTAVPGKPNKYALVTVSGKEFEVPLAVLAGLI